MKKIFAMGAIALAVLGGCATEQATNQTTTVMEKMTDSVIKSPNDNRAYKVLTLPNELQVMLVSDPAAEKSAAALSVGVGLLNDPMTQQGMAHYLEHMLFLGTERYPDTKGYSEFMTANGGAHNAYTWLDITNYMFKVNNSAYDEALDRFSDFFKAPKLYPEYTEKEKNAVNAEWSMRREMDYFGQFKLSRSMMGDHPANRFLIGNLESLGDKEGSKLHPETVDFFDQYYSANIMKVAMISKLPIAEMETLAKKYFADIPNKNIEKPHVTTPLNFDEVGQKRIHYVPNEDVKQLKLDFTIDNNSDEFAVKPNNFVSTLIGSEMPGTPAYQLKAMGLISSLSAYASPNMYGNYGTFTIDIELTDQGMQKRELIVATVMRYIDLIKQKGVDDKYFNEIKTSLNNQFRFLEKQDEFGYVSNLAAAMQEYPSEYAIAARFYYDHFDANAVNEVLTQLNPERLRVWYISQQEPSDAKLHFYDGKYKIENISDSEVDTWEQASPIALALPAVNRLLPENFDLVDSSAQDKPEVVIENDKIKVWYYPSELFASQPRGVMEIYINTPAEQQDIKANIMQSLWVDMYRLQQSALATEAQIAGMNLDIKDGMGLTFSISGFTDKQPVLLDEALSALVVKVDSQMFAQAVDRFVRGIQNEGKKFPFYQAFDAYNAVVRDGEYNSDALIDAANSLTVNDFTEFMDSLLSKNQLRIFAFGNYDKETLQASADKVIAALPDDRVNTKLVPRDFWKPEVGKTLVWQKDLTVADVALTDVHFHPEPGYKPLAQATILKAHFRNIAFDKLRTEEQLAYAVGGTSVQVKDYTGFAMYIQTPVKDVASIQQRFDDFKKEYKVNLDELSVEEFEKLKVSVLVSLKEPAKNLREEVGPLLRDWYREDYDFNSKERLIEEAEKVTLDDVKAFYAKTMLNPEAPRLSVQLRGEKFADKPFPDMPGAVKVEDLASFHKSMAKQ